MASSTESSQTMDRQEFAEYLRDLADQFDGESEANIPVGNKSVNLSPTPNVKTEIEVIERSSMLRGNKESIELNARWKRNK
ncbi:amphi-Trp domain-containing protein [Halopelagius inordinatus]|uniref:Amphi-Trp domain-containing protein n=1 Tax=Halopelagius inordinatus TaxID=553467 RepID=A0A1I2MD95_9EURY|nr:amphi-Trp domain-containing protein [Halopelagius inordinatus]SFF89435.1 amphi-Trp domain-containing protein [Halopelagius inordinatus]